MSLSADGSFTLNIPMGPFVVSGTGAAAPMATLTVTPPWSGAVSPTTTVTSPLGPSSVSATGNHSVAMDEGAGVVDPVSLRVTYYVILELTNYHLTDSL